MYVVCTIKKNRNKYNDGLGFVLASFFSAYLNVCRWIAVIDCCSRLQCKQRLNNKKTTKKHEREIRIRRPRSLPKWMVKIELTEREWRKRTKIHARSNETTTKCKPITTRTHESKTIWHNSQRFFFIANMLSTNGSYSLYHLTIFPRFFFLPSYFSARANLYLYLLAWNVSNSWWRAHRFLPVGCVQRNFNYLTFNIVIKYLIISTE